MLLTLVSLFSLIQIVKGESPLEFCSQYTNTDCGNCINHAKDSNFTCGYCAITNSCDPGNGDGPFQGKCDDWHFTYDDFCKENSSLSFSKTTKIIIICFVSIITIVTFVFWVFIFPRIFKDTSVENI